MKGRERRGLKLASNNFKYNLFIYIIVVFTYAILSYFEASRGVVVKVTVNATGCGFHSLWEK